MSVFHFCKCARLTRHGSFFPRILHYISIPVVKDAPLLAPNTSNNRWPVMVFSHGLGGHRNAYSHLVGSIASHGVIVIAPEHRDGSTPISYIRDVPATTPGEKTPPKHGKTTIDYIKLSHTQTQDVEDARNEQLRVRLWEMGLIHDSMLKVDEGKHATNLNTSSKPLSMFQGKMDVHTPGKIAFSGHSFGAATVAQFIKSVFYSPQTSNAPKEYQPLFTPSSRSSIIQQITPNTPVTLLDVWCMPLRSAATRWLWNKPFPCYADGGPGGKALLAVESQAFYKWRVHLKVTKRLLSPVPSSQSYDFSRESDECAFPQPHFYYASASAHLSQSDFGLLFPWVVKKVFAAEEPERVMRLNVRAILQLMRDQNIEVGVTSSKDMELEENNASDTKSDKLIFGTKQEIRGWNWLDTDVKDMTDVDEDSAVEGAPKSNSVDLEVELEAEPAKAMIGNELMKQNPKTEENM